MAEQAETLTFNNKNALKNKPEWAPWIWSVKAQSRLRDLSSLLVNLYEAQTEGDRYQNATCHRRFCQRSCGSSSGASDLGRREGRWRGEEGQNINLLSTKTYKEGVSSHLFASLEFYSLTWVTMSIDWRLYKIPIAVYALPRKTMRNYSVKINTTANHFHYCQREVFWMIINWDSTISYWIAGIKEQLMLC